MGRVQGWVTATVYRRRAMSLRSPAIILGINYSIILPHPRVQLNLPMNSHTRPYTDIRSYMIKEMESSVHWEDEWEQAEGL